MRKITAYRLKGTLLAIIVLALGITGTVVLYTAGKKGFQFFYDNRLDYEPKFDSFKSALTNGWTVGFVYIIVSITAVAASMSCRKGLVILHLVADIVSLILGSFLHTSSAAALVVLLLLGRYEFYTSCAFQLRYGGMGEDDMSADRRCIVARETVQLTVAAIVVLAITWLFVLIDLLFHALNYSFVASLKRSNDHLDQEAAVTHEPSQSHLHQGAAFTPGLSQSPFASGTDTPPQENMDHGTTYDETGIQLQTLDKDEPVSQNVPGTQNAAPNKEGEDKKQRH